MRSLCLQPSVPVAIAASSALCTIFVACLYLCTGKVLPNRNDPAVVKERFVRVGIASALAPFVTLASGTLLSARDEACAPQAPLLRWIGLWSPALPLAFASGLGLTMLLFLGPLVMGWLDHGQRLSLRGLVTGSQLAADLRDPRARLLVVRNLLVGPLAEEWVFRACTCPLLFGAGLGDAANVWGSAVCFGAAHLHHVFDGGGDVKAVAVMFVYTSLFGAYSSYLFLRTGTVAGPLAAHIFCNAIGLPDFAGVPRHPRRRLVAGCYVAGLAGFIAAVSLDAASRPPLFGSLFWAEAGAMGVAHGVFGSS